MKRLLYKFTVINSNGTSGRTYNQDFESKEQAEAFRRTEEVTLGFSVDAKFLRELDVSNKRSASNENNNFLSIDDSLSYVIDEPTLYEATVNNNSGDDDTTEFPRGWHRRNQFVARSGNVYVKGQIAPELWGTLPSDEY
jgi:hypothetical protein